MPQNSRCTALACLALALAAILMPLELYAQPGGPPPASVIVDQARMEPVQQYREAVGELRALRRALLAAEEEGLVIELGPEDGHSVSAGQVITQLRDTRPQMEVHRAEAELAARVAAVAERTADLARAERDLARVDELQVRGSAAQNELEDRRSAVSVAEARLDHARAEEQAAEAALDLAKYRLERCAVLAPFDGVVVSRRTEVGQWVRQGDPIIELVALDQLEARLFVPERLISALPQANDSGGQVQVRIAATGEVIFAPIDATIPEVDPLSRLIPVRLLVDNPDHFLRPGMSVAGLIPTGVREPSLTIHKDAILRDDAGEFVFFSAGGMAAVARIQSVVPLGERMAIRSTTLQPGMAVVTEGNERLMPGQPLNIVANRSAPDGGTPEDLQSGDAGTTAATQDSPGGYGER